MPNDGAGTHTRSVFIRVTRTHTDQHITHRVAPSLLPFITLLTSRINGSAACFNEQAAQPGEWRRAVITLRLEDDIARWELEPALTQAIQWLTRAPDRFSAAHFSSLLNRVGSSEQAINMLGWCGVCGWLNRLKIALGETY